MPEADWYAAQLERPQAVVGTNEKDDEDEEELPNEPDERYTV